MFMYEHDYGHLPPAALCSPDGQPLLSWRVLLLPYLNQKDLYEQFKLDESWDSAHNGALLARMPRMYGPFGDARCDPHSTFFQVFVGKGTLFEPGQKIKCDDIGIPDGRSNTILFVVAGEPVPWTKPADLPFEEGKPLPALGGAFQTDGGLLGLYGVKSKEARFHAVFADGSDRLVRKQGDERRLRALITRNGGETLNTLEP